MLVSQRHESPTPIKKTEKAGDKDSERIYTFLCNLIEFDEKIIMGEILQFV